MMTREKATTRDELFQKYQEAEDFFIEKSNEARAEKKFDDYFVYERILMLIIEKMYSLDASYAKQCFLMEIAKAIIASGSVMKPERYCQLNEMAMEIFKSIEAGLENGVD